jgi:hypothetical protein
MLTRGPKTTWRALAMTSIISTALLLPMMPDTAYAQWGGNAYPYDPNPYAAYPYGYGPYGNLPAYYGPGIGAPPGYGPPGFAGSTGYGAYEPSFGIQPGYGADAPGNGLQPGYWRTTGLR